jgi:hypothetical protein
MGGLLVDAKGEPSCLFRAVVTRRSWCFVLPGSVTLPKKPLESVFKHYLTDIRRLLAVPSPMQFDDHGRDPGLSLCSHHDSEC